MSVPEDGYAKTPKLVARFGQWRVLSENTVVIDGPNLCLLQNNLWDVKWIFPGLCVFLFWFHQQIQIWMF